MIILIRKNIKVKKIYEVKFKEYIYLVPFVESEKEIFLKTIIPSRKATKKHRLK